MNLKVGKVGPFFYIDGQIYSDSVNSDSAEKYGDFKTWGSHDKFWSSLPLKVRKNCEYTQCPRGRVTYNFVNNEYLIYLNPRINNPELIEKLVEEYNLSGLLYYVDDTDEHYQILF